jgi:transcriptional regulator GlxA family with amidase domain
MQSDGPQRRGVQRAVGRREIRSLSALAALCGLSRSYFIHAFKQITGMPPHRWLLSQRVKRAQELLRGSKLPIVEIAVACGFADQSHLIRVFSKALGICRAAWRRLRTA